MFICGDVNAKSTLWGSPRSDHWVRSLENMLVVSNKVVLNTGKRTRVYWGEGGGVYTFGSPEVVNYVVCDVLEETCGSDHYVIKVELKAQVRYEESNPALLLAADPTHNSTTNNFYSIY